MWIIFLIIVIGIFAIIGWRNANENYTAGNGLFKRSDDNLSKDEHLDPSDYNYYNSKDKLK